MMVASPSSIKRLALAGGIGSGKTQLASFLAQRYNGKVLSFAAKVKRDVLQFGLTVDGKIDKVRDRAIVQDYAQIRQCLIERADFEEYSLIRRNQMLYKMLPGAEIKDKERKFLGTCYSNYWVIESEKEMKPLLSNGVSVIFDDLRFPHEAKMLRANKFTLIRVLTDPEIRKQRLLARDGKYDASRFGDVSESYFDALDYDLILDNNGTFENTIALLDTNLT